MSPSAEALAPRPSLPGWRTPLVVIAAGCLLALLSFGIRSSFGLFLAPMSADFGWGREVFAVATAIHHLIWGLAQPVAGPLAAPHRAGPVPTQLRRHTARGSRVPPAEPPLA